MSQAFIIKCINCKKDMEQKGRNHKLCSICRVDNARKRDREYKRGIRMKTKIPKQCMVCGKEFLAGKVTSESCSQTCRNKFSNLSRQVKRWELKMRILKEKIEQNKKVLQEMYFGEVPS